MFTKSAAFYDAIYAFKDYEGEANRLHDLIQQHKQSDSAALLDVACGTGRHLTHLCTLYAAEGLDLDPALLAIARQRLPDLAFHEGDMVTFDLGRQFDAITCLFSAIGYVRPLAQMQAAVGNMACHLRPGGVLIVEPWFTPATWHPGTVHATFVNQPDLKIARMNISGVRDNLAIVDFHYLIGTPDGIEYFAEHHELALYTHEEYRAAFGAAGLRVVHDAEGLTGRGLYIGLQPSS